MIKFSLFIQLLLCVFSICYSQENQLGKSTMSTDFGSYRNRYLYPITNLKYTTSIKNDWLVSVRVRSYGTLFYFSKTAYDITPMIEYKVIDRQTWKLYTGIGSDVRLRFEKDIRGTQESSVEPMLSISPYFYKKQWVFNSPLWTRIYSNGIGLTILPEIKYQFHPSWCVYGRYELSYFTVYRTDNSQVQRDCFIGIQRRIK